MAVALGFAAVFSCTFTTNLDNLSNGQCPSSQKACGGKCVSDTDPSYNCASITSCTPCLFNNSTTTCDVRGACAIASCNSPFADCNSQPTDGCEIDTDHDPNNCGKCGTVCAAVPNGAAGCTAKHCAVGTCNAGFADCNADVTDGCETPTNTTQNCGRCGACTSPQVCSCSGEGGVACKCM